MDEEELNAIIELNKAAVHLSVFTTAVTLLALYFVGVIWPAAWWLLPAMATWWAVTRAWRLGPYREQVAMFMKAMRRR